MHGFHAHSRLGRTLRWLGDFVAGVMAAGLAFLVRVHLPLPFTLGLLPPDRLELFEAEWLVVLAAQPLLLYLVGLYDDRLNSGSSSPPRRIFAVASLQGLALMGFYFFTNRPFPRSVLLLFVLLNFLLLLSSHGLMRRLLRPPQRRLVVVGQGEAARELALAILDHQELGLEIVGHVPAPDESEDLGSEAAPGEDGVHPLLGPCLGRIDDLSQLLAAGVADDVVLAGSTPPWQTRLLEQLAGRRPGHSNILLLPGPFESLIGRMRYRWVRDLPLVEMVRQSEQPVNRLLKRGLDLLVGSLLLLAALPVLAVAAVVVKLTSPGPVLYRQTRVGAGGRTFQLWKLRTMSLDAERETGAVLAQENDPRLTPVGGVLRRLRVDELPQLLQVLGGSMSLVGPRPERPEFVEDFLREVPGYGERFSMKPGLTGLAQINGGYHSTAANKLRYDLAYMANWSLWLDLAILFQTVKTVLASRGT